MLNVFGFLLGVYLDVGFNMVSTFCLECIRLLVLHMLILLAV